MIFREHTNEFDHFVRMVSSVFIQPRSDAGWERKYQWFDMAHVSTLLSYLTNIIKRFIQVAEAVIRVQFLQK